jgi:NAD(P)-dependent dehydrogenase (short-subunit alcohol dehydrogenase family)
VSVVSALKRKGPNGFGAGSTAEEVTAGLDLSGRRYLLTGCTSGLGAEAMRVLILRGATVVGTARSSDQANAACARYGGQGVPLACDLSEPASVRACVQAVRAAGVPLDGILANAGIMALPKRTVKHGLELQFLTNHMGHFLLVTGLLKELGEDGRVVVLSSTAHTMAPKAGIEFNNLDAAQGYSPWTAYGQSKLANLLFATELSRRLPGPRQTANAVHPGVINTGLQRTMHPVLAGVLRLAGPVFLKSIPEGAATETFVATHPSVAATTGAYFADCHVAPSSPLANDTSLAQQLWAVSEALAAGFA